MARRRCIACIDYNLVKIHNQEPFSFKNQRSGKIMDKQPLSVNDSKKLFLVSENELATLREYTFDSQRRFDSGDAMKLFHDIRSRQVRNDLRTRQLVCKSCPLCLRCDLTMENVLTCQVFNKLSVRKSSLLALNEIQYQRQRLFEIFRDSNNAGTCDNLCDKCILSDNEGRCIAEKAMRLLHQPIGEPNQPRIIHSTT
jgi:hypothetical protein